MCPRWRDAVYQLTLDGLVLSDDFITLVDDRRDHTVEVEMRPSLGKRSIARFNQTAVVNSD